MFFNLYEFILFKILINIFKSLLHLPIFEGSFVMREFISTCKVKILYFFANVPLIVLYPAINGWSMLTENPAFDKSFFILSKRSILFCTLLPIYVPRFISQGRFFANP